MRRLRILIACIALPMLAWALLPVLSSGAPGQQSAAQIQKKLEETRKKIGKKKGTERLLTTEVTAYSQRIARIQGKIGTLQEREADLQADLDAKRATLVKVQDSLRSERARLTRLKLRLNETRRALSNRLVELYKADRPDLVTVLLNSNGFADLLERGEFLRRISDADRKIVNAVKFAKADASRTSKRLAILERRQQRIAAAVLQRRQQVSEIKGELIGTRVGYQNTRADKRNALSKVKEDRHDLEEHAEELEKASARITGQLAGIANNGVKGLPAQPIRGGGQWVWPVNGPITGQFGEPRPGHMHAGIDIAAPEGTPMRAADDGKVVLLQGTGASGGYGNYTCIQHTASLASCYAHQSRFGTTLGASVKKGQVMGYVGNTGHSFGAHLHFEARVNGTPVSPYNYL